MIRLFPHSMMVNALIEHIYHGKFRKTGEPFVSHPYAVREMLRKAGIRDKKILEAALLHDILEDSTLSKEYLALRFGKRVASIVELLSKKDIWATDFCKMKSSMDEMESEFPYFPEAIIIKMADRTHNLETLHGFSLPKQAEYLKETETVLLPAFRRSKNSTILKKYHKVIELLYERLLQVLKSKTIRLTTV